MARSTKGSSADQQVDGTLFDESPIKVSTPRELDVTFARFLKYERLDDRSPFEGFETPLVVTNSLSGGFIRDLFGSFSKSR